MLSLFKCLQPDIQWPEEKLDKAWVLSIAYLDTYSSDHHFDDMLLQMLSKGQRISTPNQHSLQKTSKKFIKETEYYLYENSPNSIFKKLIDDVNLKWRKEGVIIEESRLTPGFFIQWPYHISDDVIKNSTKKIKMLCCFFEGNIANTDTAQYAQNNMTEAKKVAQLIGQFIKKYRIPKDAVTFAYHLPACRPAPYNKYQTLEDKLKTQTIKATNNIKLKI